jgi:broad specificity phosphatase PhoE
MREDLRQMDAVPVVLVRHGEHERVPRDGPLTERGTAQAGATAEALALGPDDVVVATPELRTRQTALAFGRTFWVVEELADPGTVERLIGRHTAGRLVLCVDTEVIDAVLRWAFGIAPDTEPAAGTDLAHCSVTELVHRPGPPRYTILRTVGDVSHLAGPPRSP